MNNSTFNEKDIKQIESKNIPVEKVYNQIDIFKKGFPFTRLDRPCKYNDGIVTIQDDNVNQLLEIFQEAESKGRFIKFVPASGAATRMFKSLQTYINKYSNLKLQEVLEKDQDDSDIKELEKFAKGIRSFAFFNELKSLMNKDGFNIDELIDKGEFKEIIEYILTPKGLNYSNLPKGLLKFHLYSDKSRTAIEEHLVEGANYARDKDGKIRIHFTISPEHLKLVTEHIDSVKSYYEKLFDAVYEITYSVQKPSTDTLAVDPENNPFRDKDGNLVFRPAGHGALIENLNDLKADIIFIKNIDNVVPDHLKEITYLYKKLLCGYLIKIQNKIINTFNDLNLETPDNEKIDSIFKFFENELFIIIPKEIRNSELTNQKEFIFSKLNRPLRICGMVKNTGEPGGGPFWTKGESNSLSLQLVETSQIDSKSEEQKNILNNSTHFSPVDIICAVRDFKGMPYNLPDYIDPETGFISIKSKDGKELKALELPGLWNGAMSDWNTIFIEVPLITFNPVKTINDLLRNEHQRASDL